ncbi:hypothetical protein [Stutzerimonas nitrititolerans]|uniref:hypothetical protein n=1 Tax=Stutzerimonas nitrititolerans TaxID=2482751 RepID=UPI002897F6BF|nr:hypothetical protein [Stutzerimonas nitrititolerans]
MPERTYPYKAWVLMPSFKIVEVELVECYGSWGRYMEWDKASSGKSYNVERDLYPTKAAAIAVGRERVAAQQADLAKRQERLNKRIAALDKAERDA